MGTIAKPQKTIRSIFKYYMKSIKEELEKVITALQDEIAKTELQLEEMALSSREKNTLEYKEETLHLQKADFIHCFHDAANMLANSRDLCIAKEPHDFTCFDEVAYHIRQRFFEKMNKLSTNAALLNSMPMYETQSDIVQFVRNNQVSVIISDTGSRKRTQHVQVLYEAGLAGSGIIACTQPHSVAAIGHATQMAIEEGDCFGPVVDYIIEANLQPKQTAKLLYITEEVLLKEYFRDQNLSAYSCVILDVAHGRNICTDILLGIFMKCYAIRSDLRVVVMSSTSIPELFAYRPYSLPFMSSRLLPVEVEWKEPVLRTCMFDDYQEEAVRKAVEVHQSELEGDILVFLTSPLEAAVCCKRFQDLMADRSKQYVALPLHEMLTREEIQQIFSPVPDGVRKVVFATDAATSVTVPGIKYVIDTGLKKEVTLNLDCSTSSLSLTMVSQNSGKQRRACAGKCFRLYTQNDYMRMDVDSAPEVLRVDISYMVLKLMEFDADPMKFDKVLLPSFYAVKESLVELESIGAVTDGKITELGRWIAKLPFSPKYGALIYEAVQVGIGLEAVIIASASGTSSALFTKEEKGCLTSWEHESGDLLALLSVFREWCSLPENDKENWCVSHSINTSMLKIILDLTRDALYLLQQKLDIHIGFSFCEPEAADKLLVKLIFKAFSENLCHKFQYFTTDYYAVLKNTVVSIHPSSVVLSLEIPPEWIVFEGVSRLSGNFAVKITPIPEYLVMEGISDGWLKLDLTNVQEKWTVDAHHKYLKTNILEEFHKQNFGLLKSVEAEFEPEFMDIGAAFNIIHTTERIQSAFSPLNSLSRSIMSLKQKFTSEETELCQGTRQHRGSCTRAVVGAGGIIKNILMPEEFRVVEIKCKADSINTWTEKEVSEKFSPFGNIVKCRKYCHKQGAPTVWGEITYENPESAMDAVAKSNNVSDLVAHPKGYVHLPMNTALKLNFQCCRRRSKGYGIIEFKHHKAYAKAIRCKRLRVAGSMVKVKPYHKKCKSHNFVRLYNLGLHVTEYLLRDAFVKSLALSPDDIKRVVVARKRMPLNDGISWMFESYLASQIEKYTQTNDYYLEVEEPQTKDDIYFIAQCVFNNHEEGRHVHWVMNNVNHFFRGNLISVSEGIHDAIVIDEAVYKENCEEIMKVAKAFATEGIQISRNMKAKMVTMNLYSEDSVDACAKLSVARKDLKKIIRGDTIRVEKQPAAQSLFSEKGLSILQMVMDKTGAVILTDDRLKVLSLHGSLKKRKAALAMINQNLQELDERELDIRIGEKVLEMLQCKYGNDLGGLAREPNISSVEFLNQESVLKVSGTEEAVDNVNGVVEEMRLKLLDDEMAVRNACVNCFSPADVKDLWRLVSCGHTYCKKCMQVKISEAVNTCNFPIVCGRPCCLKLVWKDFLKLNYKDNIALSKLISSSLSLFVSQHKDEFQYCPTPNCPMVYRTSRNGISFMCTECKLTICTYCHVPYHFGLMCTQYKGKKDSTPKFCNEKIKIKVEYKQSRNIEKEMNKHGKVLPTSMKNCMQMNRKKNRRRELRTFICQELKESMVKLEEMEPVGLEEEIQLISYYEFEDMQFQSKVKKQQRSSKIKKKGKKIQEENVRMSTNQEIQEQNEMQKRPPKTAKKKKSESQGNTKVQKHGTGGKYKKILTWGTSYIMQTAKIPKVEKYEHVGPYLSWSRYHL